MCVDIDEVHGRVLNIPNKGVFLGLFDDVRVFRVKRDGPQHFSGTLQNSSY